MGNDPVLIVLYFLRTAGLLGFLLCLTLLVIDIIARRAREAELRKLRDAAFKKYSDAYKEMVNNEQR